MKRAIVSGATGAVGTALIQSLINKNIEVLVICRPGSERNDRLPEHPLVIKSYCSLEHFKDLQNNTGKMYDVFYHFAWDGTIGQARNDLYLQNKNVLYSLDAVELAKRFGCRKFIGAGSQAEYGRVSGVLKPETPVAPESGYGIAKLCAGQMTRMYAHQLDMQHIWVRILSVYGPNDGMQSMVMSTISKLKNGETAIFTKGEQIWDYLYSEDAAEAFCLLADRGTDGKTYVLGGGTAYKLSKYISDIREVVNPEGDVALGAIPYSPEQVMHLQADISALNQDTGFAPRVQFRDGIKNILKTDSRFLGDGFK